MASASQLRSSGNYWRGGTWGLGGWVGGHQWVGRSVGRDRGSFRWHLSVRSSVAVGPAQKWKCFGLVRAQEARGGVGCVCGGGGGVAGSVALWRVALEESAGRRVAG